MIARLGAASVHVLTASGAVLALLALRAVHHGDWQMMFVWLGAALVVDKGATLASASNIDVTNDVLAALNQQLPSVSVTPLPQPPAAARPQGR